MKLWLNLWLKLGLNCFHFPSPGFHPLLKLLLRGSSLDLGPLSVDLWFRPLQLVELSLLALLIVALF